MCVCWFCYHILYVLFYILAFLEVSVGRLCVYKNVAITSGSVIGC
jgi:hypothetical protein